LVLALFGVGGFVACSNSSALDAEIAQGCLITSDCASPLICAFETCHAQCHTSADCATPAGSHCVTDGPMPNVCEPPTLCSFNTQCPGSEVCAPDGQCRDQCHSAKDCVSGQDCVDEVCADPSELTADGGLMLSGAGKAALAAPCSYNSDCAPPLYCVNDVCAPECQKDVDCPAGQVCVKQACVTTADGG
jgi:hypothetical protein